MKVLVLGATGYLGRHVVRNLVSGGHAVYGFARNEAGACTVAEDGAQPVHGDLADIEAVPALVDGFDAVIMAAQLMLDEEYRLVSAMLDALEGTDRCFVFTSGTSVMSIPTGGDWDERSFAEDEPFVPRRQIAPRLAAEQIVRDAATRGVRAMVVRPPLIWGNGGCQIIAQFYHSARTTGAVCHVGRGLNVYSNVHVEDLAQLYRLCIEKGRAGALYFAVAGEVSYGVMAAEIARNLGGPTRSVTVEEACEIWGKGLGGIVLCSCSRQRSPRAREELGWTPDQARLNILEDCRNPAYAAQTDRPAASWVRPAS
ncbi:NAD-dependent epimerase/dehydratase family protein [Novosphingobium resinovorum]|uniref:NAD-dependent epimerase/dehydratase family protein n=1 Tax=Novosphingobium resinovorum TaxID=158500 RepID=UPI002ED2CC7F|nr:NAD-dependent epimerase/dehydratase family protein [Novosphingobium resinovorum]